MKKINVIIPNYNYGKYLEMCLMSVYMQKTNCEIEILVNDDCSTDYSIEILSRFKNYFEIPNIKLNFFENQNNKGEIQTTKFLLEKCDGDYIAYLDSDDYWIDPNKLQKQFDFLEKNQDYSLSHTGYLELREDQYVPHAKGDYFFGPPSHFDVDGIFEPEFIARERNCIFSSSRFFRNYGDLALNYFDTFAYSDWPLNFELSLRGKINYSSYPSYVYRVHPNSLSKKEMGEKDPNNTEEWRLEKVKILEARQNEYKLLNQI